MDPSSDQSLVGFLHQCGHCPDHCFFAPMKIWVLYNGLISCVLMGGLLLGEFVSLRKRQSGACIGSEITAFPSGHPKIVASNYSD